MKKLNKKTVINEQHDPLSWLMQGAEDKKNNTEDMAPAKTVDSTISSNVTDAIVIEEITRFEQEASDLTNNIVLDDGVENSIDDPVDNDVVNKCSDQNISSMSESTGKNIKTEESENEELIMQSINVEKNNDSQVDEIMPCSDDTTISDDMEILVLDEDISIIHVAKLKENWLPYVDSLKNITIDAEKVEDIDTAGLQLLLSFVKTIKEKGRKVSWQAPSETLVTAVTETALKDVIGLNM